MRLERVFTHRAVRLLRVVLPVLVIVLVAIPAWNYLSRRAQRADSPRLGAKLPSGVSVRTEGFTYSQTEGGRTQFTIHAKQSLGFKDEKYILQDVDVTVFGSTDQDPARKVRGQNCTYDQTTNDFTCNGNVEVELDPKTIVRTDNLIYNHHDGIVTAPQRAAIEQNGTRGQANSFEYGMTAGLLKLNGDVSIETADHVLIESGSVLFQQKENWATMSGGVLMRTPSGWIRGLTGRADLRPGTYRPNLVTVDGNVTAESQVKGNQMWKLRAGRLEATISDEGMAEHVKTRGNAEIEKIAGDARQNLSGGEIDIRLKDGKVDVIDARQNARMVMGSDQMIESPQILTNSAGSEQTAGNSILKVGDSTIQGADFVIENGEDLVEFSTRRPATLKKEGGQESSSDQTRARFDNRTNMLMDLVQTGNFQFRTPQYQGRAKTGRFEEGGTLVTLDGSSVLSDSQKRLEASQIRINQKDNSFVATRNVSTLMKDSAPSGKGNEQALVKAAKAEGGADSMLYTGNVQLWRGDAYIKAERLNVSGMNGQSGKLHAEAAPGDKVQSNLQNIRATSETLDYDDTGGLIRYLGHVHAQKQDMILEAPEMTVSLREKNLTEIVASGGVVVTRADQRGTAEKAVYDAGTDVVTLTGKNSQVRDREHGLVQGSRLTIGNKGQAASVEGGPGERTITKHPVKK